jgi:hypothetical protein
MRRIIFTMFLMLGILTAHAQRASRESSKIMTAKYSKPGKKERKPEFNKYDSSFNKKLNRQKKKETVAKRRKAKSNSRIREMEVQHNKRNVELARKMELKRRESNGVLLPN